MSDKAKVLNDDFMARFMEEVRMLLLYGPHDSADIRDALKNALAYIEALKAERDGLAAQVEECRNALQYVNDEYLFVDDLITMNEDDEAIETSGYVCCDSEDGHAKDCIVGKALTSTHPAALEDVKREAVKEFVDAVERRAESNMLKTGKLEGAHYRAMKDLLAEMKAED